ncbi:MAG: putative Ig domain-containing protein [Nostocales cyanobacterium 94392]|nr:putative Ig domain-containing protein [Nostocales cyanobacterium 94392]
MENFASLPDNDLSNVTPNFSENLFPNSLNIGDIFTVPGSVGETTLSFEWVERNAAFNNEVGVFVVDELGQVGGVAPEEAGYAEAAINDASRQVIFSSGQGAGAQRQLTFQAGDTLGFYLIQNDLTKDWLTSNVSNNISNDPIAFFSIDGVNPDQFDHIQRQDLGDGVQQFRWEDSTFGGDHDFNDVVFNVSAVRSAVLVPGESGEIVPVTFNKVSQEASFHNEMGLFVVDDAQGRIGSILPGQPGYIEAALSDSRRDIIFASGQTSGTAKTMELPAKSYIGFYLIQNATTERFLNHNPQNELNKEPLAFFFFPQENPDGIDHLQSVAVNSFGWEDLTNGGDKDFDDLVFEYTFDTPTSGVGGGDIQLSIDDVAIVEGDTNTTEAKFTVSLSAPSSKTVTVDFSTADDTAIADADYQAVNGTITFKPGETTQSIIVPIIDDRLNEADETFFINLNNASNAIIADTEGKGTIIDNELPSISASLANDTGASDSDRITVDPTINGQAIGATSLQGNLNGNGFVDISDALSNDGSFTISLEQYEVLSNNSLPDGNYVLELKASNDFGRESDVITVNFTLDRTPPPIDFDLATQSDTGELGDRSTTERIVTLVGQTEPGLEMVLVETQKMVTADSDGNFSLTDVPMPIAGTAPFSLVTVDIAGNLGRVQKQFTRIGINGAPEIISTPETVFDTDEGDSYTYQIEAVDPDNDTLTYSLLNGLQGVEIDTNGLLTFTPEGNLRTSYDFNIEISDGRGGTDTQAFTVEIPNVVIDNRPPTFTSTPIIESNVGTEYSYQPTATDPDGDTLTFSLIEDIPGLSIETETGLLLWTPTVEQLGDNSVAIQVSDEEGLTDTQSFTISVQDIATNAAPIFISDPVTDFAVAVPNTATGDVNPELISLNLSDGEMATESVSITLPDGGTSTGGQADIVFVVDESGSMSGEHEWLTNMVLELDAALQDRGITDNRYSLIGYTNQTRLFNLAAQTQVSVYSPGNQLVASGSFESVINEPELVFNLLTDGTYTVVISASGTAVPLEYELNGTVIDIPAVALTNFNTPFTGTIAPQAEETFTFDAPAGSQILLDVLGSSASNDIRARLVDPNGDNVFSFARLNQDSSPYLLSEAGTYSLIVSGGNAVGDFSFQLLDFNSAATKIAPDTEIAGTIATGLATKVFQFDATKGQQIYFDSVVSPNIRTALYASDNQLLGSSFSLRDFSAVVPSDGTYTLILRSDSENAVDYNFRLVTPEIEQTTLTIGEVITGSLSEAGEKDVYLTEGTAGQRIWFDGLASDSFNIDIRMTSPTGQTLINNLGANRDSGMLTLPETGTYSIVVNGDDFTGDYSFRVLDEENANSLTLDTNFTSTVEPGSGAEIYTLEGTAGQELLFDMVAIDSRFSGSWALYGAASNDFIARNTVLDDFSAVLPTDGTYTLVVNGSSTNPINYTFNISDITTPTNITSSGFDTIRTGTLTTSDQEDIFTFDATAGTRIVFDGLTSASSNINARLTAPNGTVLFSNQRLNNDLGQLTLPESGTYSIAVNTRGDLGDYSFRVLNLDNAKTLPLDSVFNGTLNVGQGIDIYEFTGSKGQRLFFDGISATGSGNWQLYSPENLELAQSRLDRDFTATLAADGIYKILFDGENQTPFDFSVQVGTPQTQVSTLAIGDIVSGALTEPGEQDIYQFNGVVGQQIWFDGLESAASEIEVALVNPFGERIFERVELNQDSDTPFTLFESGEYSLIVNSGRGNPGSVTGDYSFQVLEITSNLTLPNNITGTFNLPNESQVFQFEGIKGQKFTINPTEATFGTATQASNATSFLSTAQGGTEDGYLGIDTALGLPFRDGAATNIILVTDEDRDIVNLNLTFESIFNKLDSQDALLNATINGSFLDGNGNSALGVDSQGIAYIADGAGGFITSPGGAFGVFSTIKADYVDLAWDSAGAAWDLNQLREGGDTAVSFTKAFVNVKAEEISDQLAVDILATDPNVTVENLTGPLFGVNPGETASFDTKITGDGLARDFELFFVRPDTGFVLGSIPVSINQNYLYLAQAVDPDGDPITYSLLNAPTGASIDSATGRIDWTPPTTGIYQFEIAVADNRGAQTTQIFEVEVVAAGGDNTAPTITSTAPDTIRVGSNLEYQVTATDAESDPLTYFLAEAPEGVTIASDTGLVSWTPAEAQTGEQTITVKVVDSRGGSDTQSFVLTVDENQKPIFNSNPFLATNPNQLYEYDVDASDPEGTAITYSLRNGAPDGMTIDSDTGVIQWTPTAEQQGQFPITVFANDAEGERALQSFLLNVGNSGSGVTGGGTGGTGGTDSEIPIVSLGFNSNVIEIGEDLNLQVRAVDDEGITSLELLVDGSPVTLNPGDITNGTVNQAVVNFDQAGLVDILAIANDADGNVGTKTLSVRVIDPNDTESPSITIDTSQFVGGDTTLESLTNIIGTVEDESLEFFRLEIAPISRADINNPSANDADYTVIAQSNSGIDGVLGTIDPRKFANGSYFLRAIAGDFSGNINIQGIPVTLYSAEKSGQFRVEINDLTVPLAGIPIQINRVYDSFDADESGDFGFGWSLKTQEARIEESAPVTDNIPGVPSLFSSTPLKIGDTVTLTNPNGERVSFIFDPFVDGASLLGAIWKPRFTPAPGVFDRLEVDDISLSIGSDGSAGLFFIPFPYNPENYRLITRDGTSYTYNQFDGLQKIEDTNGNTLTYTDEGIFSSTGTAISFTRDSAGRITAITDPNGNTINYSYDANGDLIALTDQENLTTTHSYLEDNSHYLDKIIDPRGKTISRTEFDNFGRITKTTDALGNTSTRNYIDNPDGTITEVFTNPQGQVNTTVRDSRGNIVSETDAVGATTTTVYDENNNPIQITDPRGFTTTRTFDAQGNITSITDALNNTTTFTYDQFSNVTSETDPLGRITQFSYDDNGNLVELIDATRESDRFTYDNLGRVSSFIDANGNSTNFDYDGTSFLDKPTQVTFPDGSTQQIEYNQFGQITRLVDENGNATEYILDSVGRLIAVRDPLGNETTYSYDAQFITSITDSLGNTERYEYDDAGRLIRQINPLNGVTEFGYDALGRRISETDPLGNTTTTTYRDDGLITAITDAEGNITSFEYDLAGNQTAVIDPLGNRTTFVYDALGRQISQTDPLGNVSKYRYDAVNNLIEIIDRNNRQRNFTYDAVDRLTQEQWHNNGTSVRIINFTYDDVGNLLSATNSDSTNIFTYNDRDRVTQVSTDISGLTTFDLNYSYDGTGNRTSVSDNLGVSVNSSYDPRNLLTSQTWQGSGIDTARVEYSYNSNGDRNQIERFSDVNGTQLVGSSTFEYDALRRLTEITHFNGSGNVLADYEYNYNAASFLNSETYKGQTTNYTYDKTNQLTNADRSVLADENYTYDENGNPTGNGFVIGANNQILSNGEFNYSYDNEGNLTSKTNIATGDITTYTYDFRNRLVKVVDTDTNGNTIQTVEFRYDAFDRRISKTVDGETTYFINDGDDIWAELNQAGEIVNRYLQGGNVDELIARYNSDEGTNWYLTDRLGTIRDIVNEVGNLVNSINYNSFGEILGQTNPNEDDRFAFTGREYDEETGLYYYRARYYDLSLGRFISQDPIGFGGEDANLYRYVGNNPVNATDPSGLFAAIAYGLVTSKVTLGPIGSTSGALIGFLQGFGGTSLIFIGNILEIANTGGDVIAEWGTAIAKTRTKLQEIEKALEKFNSVDQQGIVAGFIDGAGFKLSITLKITVGAAVSNGNLSVGAQASAKRTQTFKLGGGGFVDGYEQGLKYLEALQPR